MCAARKKRRNYLYFRARRLNEIVGIVLVRLCLVFKKSIRWRAAKITQPAKCKHQTKMDEQKWRETN